MSALFAMDGAQWISVMPYISTNVRTRLITRHPDKSFVFSGNDCDMCVSKKCGNWEETSVTFTFKIAHISEDRSGILPRFHMDVVFETPDPEHEKWFSDHVCKSVVNVHAALGEDVYSSYVCRLGKHVIASYSLSSAPPEQTSVIPFRPEMLDTVRTALKKALDEVDRVINDVFDRLQCGSVCQTCDAMLPIHTRIETILHCDRCRIKRDLASGRIARAFRRCASDPSFALCRNRLMTEFQSLKVTEKTQ